MTSIGETLHGERMRRNLELTQISNTLKISAKFLEAMEADRFDKLPGGVFTKSFVRQYAQYIGQDDQEIAAAMQRMQEPPSVPPEVYEAKPHVAVNIDLPRVTNLLSVGDSRFAWSSSLRSLALVVVVVLVCSAVYSWSQRGRRPAAAPSNAPVTAQKANPPQSVPVEPVKAQETPAASSPDTSTAERVISSPVRVQLTAEKAVWVLATTDGKYAFSDTMEPNASRIIEANDRVFLKLGNAGGVHVLLNGKPVGPLGEEGQVLRVQFTSGGFQIVPAEAPAPTPEDDGPSEPGDSPPGEPLAPR
jgi:cytoskeleton protein RodZ